MQTDQGTVTPTNAVCIKRTLYPAGWNVASYDYNGYASHGTHFTDKVGARRFAKWLASRGKPLRIIWVK